MPDFDLTGELSLKIELHMLRPITGKVHSGNGSVSLVISSNQTSGSGTTSLAWTYMKVCGYSDIFCKNLNQRSFTPRWPLTPHLLRSYVWLYPRIIVAKSHENTSKYVDTLTFFAKTWSKGHWPLGDLWPHICWGHMCDSTQGSLCPSPMKIH